MHAKEFSGVVNVLINNTKFEASKKPKILYGSA